MPWTGVIGGDLGYRVLKKINPEGEETSYCSGAGFEERSKLEHMFGSDIWRRIQNRTVLDFGCGYGMEAIEMAQRGAHRVIGLDTSQNALAKAHSNLQRTNARNCTFTAESSEPADLIISLDAFEHYDDPEGTLRYMKTLLKPDGEILVCFGPPWLHPFGGHLFSVFPWSHLLFTERAQLRWRADFKTDGATRFREVEGGLNQMTIGRFERLVEHCGFQFASFEVVPVRKLRWISGRLTREFTTAVVRCCLRIAIENTRRMQDQ